MLSVEFNELRYGLIVLFFLWGGVGFFWGFFGGWGGVRMHAVIVLLNSLFVNIIVYDSYIYMYEDTSF